MKKFVVKKKYKISFCTVCMNRLNFLKQTLPKNIKDNLKYGNVEFIVLDYNSKDNLGHWIQNNMSDFIEQGILKYIKTTDPQYFMMSHSKNVVSKQASGDIICNVDADNFIGKGFAEFINDSYQNDNNIFLAVDKKTTQRDCFGRICLRKDDFSLLRGYDESMKGYGFEDFDLRNRLKFLGRKESFISNKDFLHALTHNDNERLKNEYNNVEIESVYIKHKTPSISEIVYCFVNKAVFVGDIVENRTINAKSIDNIFIKNRDFEYEYKLKKDKWKLGKIVSFGKISFKDKTVNIENNPNYFKITDKDDLSNLIMSFSQISNRIIMKKNLKEKRITINSKSYGDVNFKQ